MMTSLKSRRIASLALGVALAAAAIWIYAARRQEARRDHVEPVPIQEGKTIDFSGGSPVVKDDAANKARMEAALKEIDEASRTVTFSGEPTPTKK
jgi:hypothetical protein